MHMTTIKKPILNWVDIFISNIVAPVVILLGQCLEAFPVQTCFSGAN